MSELGQYQFGQAAEQFRIFRPIFEMRGGSQVADVEDYFKEKELGGKSIPAQEVLTKRLNELAAGRNVPVVVFNCLDFGWEQSTPGDYPLAVVRDEVFTSNATYYKEQITDTRQQLLTIGNPEITIIVPDSELFDTNVFPFKQDINERFALREAVTAKLQEVFPPDSGISVISWSTYCETQELMAPTWYTQKNYEKIGQDPVLVKKVIKQAKDSRQHFVRGGLDPEYIASIPDDVMADMTAQYLAMYAGEGEALKDSKTIVINLEDMRVSAWYQRGADGQLPVVTPVNPTDWYRWRNAVKIGE